MKNVSAMSAIAFVNRKKQLCSITSFVVDVYGLPVTIITNLNWEDKILRSQNIFDGARLSRTSGLWLLARPYDLEHTELFFPFCNASK
jgi:hypothetical protein